MIFLCIMYHVVLCQLGHYLIKLNCLENFLILKNYGKYPTFLKSEKLKKNMDL